MENLYNYYKNNNISPTYAALDTSGQLDYYEQIRKTVFERMAFPIDWFAGKQILSFGPDSGENELVFAKWDATLQLVEPNRNSHPLIRKYFTQFGFDTKLLGISEKDLLSYSDSLTYDFVDAEGFLYTIQPTNKWVSSISQYIKPGGYLLIHFMEFYGSFYEILLKSILKWASSNSSQTEFVLAEKLFERKWNSIAHTRKFHSWYQDVIQNPFVRTDYLIRPSELLLETANYDLHVDSAWPAYKNPMDVTWIKASVDRAKQLNENISFLNAVSLGRAFGVGCYIDNIDQSIMDAITRLILIVDSMITKPEADGIKKAQEIINNIFDYVKSLQLKSHAGKDLIENIGMVKTLLGLLDAGEGKLVEYCNSDPLFIRNWGVPTNYLLFKKAN
jgi:hypothetical protein